MQTRFELTTSGPQIMACILPDDSIDSVTMDDQGLGSTA